jgi:hypothetical protein
MGRKRQPYSMFKRSGSKLYLVQFLDPDGKRFTRSSGQTSRAAAARWAEAFLEDLQFPRAKSDDEGTSCVTPPIGEVTLRGWFGDGRDFWFTRYLTTKTARGHSIRRTAAIDGERLTRIHLLPRFGDVDFRGLTVDMIDQWVDFPQIHRHLIDSGV